MSLANILSSSVGRQAAGSTVSLARSLGFSMPASLRAVLRRATLQIIRTERRAEHIFVLMLENRSFDHIFGFSGIVGTDAVTRQSRSIIGLRHLPPEDRPTNTAVVNGEARTFSPTDDAQLRLSWTDKDPPHEFHQILTQLTGQPMGESAVLSDGRYPLVNNQGFAMAWVEAKTADPDKAMSCFAPDKVPVMMQLAREFAVCDNWFASLPGPTFPNRFFLYAASSSGLDHSPEPGEIIGWTSSGYRFENGTFFQLLEKAGSEWLVFEGDEFPTSWALEGTGLVDFENHFIDLEELGEEINKDDFKARFILIEPNYNVIKLGEPYVCGTSMHPRDDVARGEGLIKKVYETLRASRIWQRSVLVVVFDEHGGFYDHVPPPAGVTPGDRPIDPGHNKHGFKFDQLGPRVPAIIISPWIPANTVDVTQYDHTSVLASCERLLNLPSLTNRDAHANDFLHLLALNSPRTDTPRRLSNPADSSYDCDEAEAGAGADASALASQNLADMVAVLSRGQNPTESPDLGGFVQIAIRRHLALVPAAQRAAALQRIRAIRSREEMAGFIRETRKMIRVQRRARRRRD
jgi:phospholipase C